MTNVYEHIPEARIIAKVLFFFFFFLNSLALFIGVILSVVDVEPAGSNTIGGSLVFFFGLLVGLSTTFRELLFTFNLVKRPASYDDENTLVLEEMGETFHPPTPVSPSTRNRVPEDDIPDDLVIDAPPKKRSNKKD